MLTKNFLKTKACELGLTAEQEEVFVLKFGDEMSNQDIAGRLGISTSAFVQCLGEIYKKAGIEGRSRGKASRLQSELIRGAEQQVLSISTVASLPASNITLAIDQSHTGQKELGLPGRNGGSEHQYLQAWLNRIQHHEKVLSSEKGWDEVDHVLNYFTEHLSASTTALAAFLQT